MSAYPAKQRKDATQQLEQMSKDERLYSWTRNVLVAGMLVSLTLMFVGMVLYVVSGGNGQEVFIPIIEIPFRVAAADPLGIVILGIVILALTPAFSVLASFAGFLLGRDFQYALVSLGVLLVLALSIFFKP